MLAFLARECGWTKEYISENMTIDQIGRYVESLHRLKRTETKERCIVFFHAAAAANGNMKQKAWNDFLKVFDDEKPKGDVDLTKLKDMGYSIEDN